MQLSVHLGFDGKCEEAFRFYEKVLHGKITFMQSYAGSPAEEMMPPEQRGKILHVSLEVDGQMLMGADSPPDRHTAPHGFAVSVQVNDTAEADRIYNALVEGGKVQMPMQETFWSPKFGMCIDRFGIPWMINTAGMPQG